MKVTFIAAAMLCFSLAVSAQEPESRIALTPYVYYDIESVPQAASSALERKLTSMATANGFAGVSDVFVITAVPEVMDVSMTPTAPAQFVVDMEVEVYVLNNPEEVIVGQTVYALKGVGASEQKAVINAINQINVKSTDTRRFMENARSGIIAYYSSKLPAIIAKAQSYANMTKYDGAAIATAGGPADCDKKGVSMDASDARAHSFTAFDRPAREESSGPGPAGGPTCPGGARPPPSRRPPPPAGPCPPEIRPEWSPGPPPDA